MKFGLEERHWQIVEDLCLKVLKHHGARTWIFGSRARGDQKPFSDLDIMFSAGHQKVPLAVLGRIKSSLTESNLPIKVDVVDESEFAESYRQQALRDRIEI